SITQARLSQIIRRLREAQLLISNSRKIRKKLIDYSINKDKFIEWIIIELEKYITELSNIETYFEEKEKEIKNREEIVKKIIRKRKPNHPTNKLNDLFANEIKIFKQQKHIYSHIIYKLKSVLTTLKSKNSSLRWQLINIIEPLLSRIWLELRTPKEYSTYRRIELKDLHDLVGILTLCLILYSLTSSLEKSRLELSLLNPNLPLICPYFYGLMLH
ncbi:MAG: hypothetical protein J7L39_01270, partial [Candidatus Aenigmarchaeota archaeon]|nr:hypothetical protein [Candidatus Aenigmarchaeota archaeon]